MGASSILEYEDESTFAGKILPLHLLCKLWNADDLNLNHNGRRCSRSAPALVSYASSFRVSKRNMYRWGTGRTNFKVTQFQKSVKIWKKNRERT